MQIGLNHQIVTVIYTYLLILIFLHEFLLYPNQYFLISFYVLLLNSLLYSASVDFLFLRDYPSLTFFSFQYLTVIMFRQCIQLNLNIIIGSKFFYPFPLFMSEQNASPQSKRRIKVVLLGDRSVGKSSIINRFITDHFEENLQPTVGVDFMGKNVRYKGNMYRVELWDTAGQEKYRSLVKGYLKGADACVFVYDCTSISSYSNLPEWVKLFDSVASPEAYKIAVGNKCDAEFNTLNLQQSKKQIKLQNEGLRTIPQFVSSAKLGINIQQIFEQIIHNYTMRKNKSTKDSNLSKVLISISNSTSNCCK